MLHRSIKIELAGEPYRLWLGFATQRRLGCRTLQEVVNKCLAMREVSDDGQIQDFYFDAIEDVLWASLHRNEPAKDGRTLVHCGLSKDRVRELIELDGDATNSPQAHVLARLYYALDAAFAAAHIVPRRADTDETEQSAEVGDEADADPTVSLSIASSEPLPASA